MDVFDFIDYKKSLKATIEKNTVNRGYNTRLATAAGCSRSFLSQVLSSDIDLTRDHGAGICEFWRLSDEETEYFLTLVDKARAKSAAQRNHLEQKIKRLKKERTDLSRQIKREHFEDASIQAIYYSSWTYSAVHMLMTISEFSDSKSIANRLRIEVTDVDHIIEKLTRIGLVEKTGKGFRPTKKDINLPENAPMSAVNHINWRHQAIASTQNRKPGSIHYSSVFTMGREDADQLRKLIRDFSVKTREIIGPSPCEELFCFNLDFFQV